jgi:PAS domain S-box-containing protein
MHDFLVHTAEILASLAVIGGFVASVWAFSKKPWLLARAWVKKAEDTIAKVDVMSKALGPNGGASLYDKITATEERSQLTGVRTDWLCDQLDRPSFECAPDGANVRINSSFTNQFGYSAAEMLGQRWVRMVLGDDRDRVMTEWTHAIDDQRMFESTYRAITRAGVAMRVRVVAEPQPHPQTGKVIRWLGRIEIVKSEVPV